MIISISGPAGSGKDTCADALVKSGDWVKVALADPLKRICYDVFGFTPEQLWGPSEMRNAPDTRYPRYTPEAWEAAREQDELPHGPQFLSARYALQQLGTEFGRNCYPDIWIEYALRVANSLAVKGGYNYTQRRGLSHDWYPGDDNWHSSVVIPDARFRNELEAIRAAGGKLIRIKRPGAGLEGSAGQHVSETEQQGIPDAFFDHVLQNDSDVPTLQSRMRMLVALMQGGMGT